MYPFCFPLFFFFRGMFMGGQRWSSCCTLSEGQNKKNTVKVTFFVSSKFVQKSPGPHWLVFSCCHPYECGVVFFSLGRVPSDYHKLNNTHVTRRFSGSSSSLLAIEREIYKKINQIDESYGKAKPYARKQPKACAGGGEGGGDVTMALSRKSFVERKTLTRGDGKANLITKQIKKRFQCL